MPNEDAKRGPAVLQPRLSVAWVSAPDRADLVGRLGRAATITRDDVVASARTLAAERAASRAAALGRLERDLAATLEAREEATAERDRAERRLTRLNEGVAWSDKAWARLPELGEAVRKASTEAGLREIEHQAARTKLEQVVEQRAEAAAATDAATRELQGLDGSQLDETSLRREVESANRTAHESAAARARGRGTHRGARGAGRCPGQRARSQRRRASTRRRRPRAPAGRRGIGPVSPGHVARGH